jgi:CRISPR-associated protein Csx17
MAAVVLGGVSPRSLGDLLKGYGMMAIVGENCPDALFWWDEAFHLAIERPCDADSDPAKTKQAIENLVRGSLLCWGKNVAEAFKPTRQKSCDKPLPCSDHRQAKQKAKKKTCPEVVIPRRDSTLKLPGDHDRFEPDMARWARAIALPRPGRDETEPHPLFPAHGQEGSGDYFSQLEKAVEGATAAPDDIAWSLFAEGSPALNRELDSGYLFFPEPMKRYATGVAKWVQDRAAISPWCFLLAVRGALLLRGSLRRLRWGRRTYPAFSFVFEGATVELGKGKFFRNVEIHLPTWDAERPRTLAELEMQVRQFQARLSARGFAATAAEFRAAVVGRGAGAAFDTFHRFVLEGRRPGQRQPMRQGIPRGATRVGGRSSGSGTLRLMLAPLAETGWFDQFVTDRLRAARASADEAIHRAVDEPGLDTYRGVLEKLWDLNRALVLPGALRRELEDAHRTPRPVPPLPARLWEQALMEGLHAHAAYRLGGAIGSILGVRAKDGATVGPVLEHMLPVERDGSRWKVPDPDRRHERSGSYASRSRRWTGGDPLGDFRALFWSRWLDSAVLPRLPFAGARCASLADVAALLRGEVDVREVHRLVGLFALLDWQGNTSAECVERSRASAPVPPAYAALRLWLELGTRPAPDSRPPRDGNVARLLSLGSAAQVERAAALALSRLRVDGLPWSTEPRPTGKAVARFQATIPREEAARMALAVMIPVSLEDTLTLSRRLWVPTDEEETAA